MDEMIKSIKDTDNVIKISNDRNKMFLYFKEPLAFSTRESDFFEVDGIIYDVEDESLALFNIIRLNGTIASEERIVGRIDKAEYVIGVHNFKYLFGCDGNPIVYKRGLEK